jgi:isocitrate dehydrogenase
VLKSFRFFRAVFDEVASAYADVEAEHMHTDASAQALVLRPGRFDVLVTENFVGDLLSDLGGGTVGGIGMCASANIGTGTAVFEPVHPRRAVRHAPGACSACAPTGGAHRRPAAASQRAAIVVTARRRRVDVARTYAGAASISTTSRPGLVP